MNDSPHGIISLPRGIEILRGGGVVAIPTETVYGLAARADMPNAIAEIFAAKKRPFFDPLIVHLSHAEQVELVAEFVPAKAQKLMDKFWPGPLSVVLPKKKSISDLISAGLPTVAVRCPDHDLARRIIAESGFPLAAPSANLFGKISPTSAEAVWQQLHGRIDGVIDGGACSVGVESTIVAFWDESVVLLRPGGIPLEAIQDIIGEIQVGVPVAEAGAAENSASTAENSIAEAGASTASTAENQLEAPTEAAENSTRVSKPLPAPGTTASHYAPQKAMLFYPSIQALPQDRTWRQESALLLLQKESGLKDFYVCKELSPTGDLSQAAVNLYAYMRKLDALPVKRIVAVALPEESLGLAINDRLFRAAGSQKAGF